MAATAGALRRRLVTAGEPSFGAIPAIPRRTLMDPRTCLVYKALGCSSQSQRRPHTGRRLCAGACAALGIQNATLDIENLYNPVVRWPHRLGNMSQHIARECQLCPGFPRKRSAPRPRWPVFEITLTRPPSRLGLLLARPPLAPAALCSSSSTDKNNRVRARRRLGRVATAAHRPTATAKLCCCQPAFRAGLLFFQSPSSAPRTQHRAALGR